MSSLLDKYLNTKIDYIKKAQQQSLGELAGNYFDGEPRSQGNNIQDVYQREFFLQEPGRKYHPVSTEEDSTNGSWLPKGLFYYAELLDKNRSWNGKVVHKYSQRERKSHYVSVNEGTPGVVNQAKDNEIL